VSAAAPAPAVPSPCIGICRMHEATGWCEGCLRTLAEIAAWGQLADPAKRQLLQQLPARRLVWRQRADAPRPVSD